MASSWIDLFARGDITINGKSGTAPFSVHANGLGGSGGDGEEGGIVTVKSTQGSVAASGKALQASSTRPSGSDAGRVTVEAALAVTFSGSTPTLEAKGHDLGGAIAARAFTGALSWLAGVGDVRPNATGTIPHGLHGHSTTPPAGRISTARCPARRPTARRPRPAARLRRLACLRLQPSRPPPCVPRIASARPLARRSPRSRRGAPNHTTLSEAVQQASTGRDHRRLPNRSRT